MAGAPVTVATNVVDHRDGGGPVRRRARTATSPTSREEPASLVFVDRHGASRLATPRAAELPSPAVLAGRARGSRSTSTRIEGRNVWILDLDEGTLTRATFDRDGHDATWTPDGRFLTYIAPVSRPAA